MKLKFSDYKTVKEAAEEWDISERRVLMFCTEERIPGTIKKGHMWLIPASAPKPPDGRRKNTSEKGKNIGRDKDANPKTKR